MQLRERAAVGWHGWRFPARLPDNSSVRSLPLLDANQSERRIVDEAPGRRGLWKVLRTELRDQSFTDVGQRIGCEALK